MSTRIKLQSLLEEVLGSRNVYFQPPESLKMRYPAIVYELEGNLGLFSGGKHYLSRRRYSLTAIDEDPDSILFDKLKQLEYCTFDRQFTSDNLNHYTFTIFY